MRNIDLLAKRLLLFVFFSTLLPLSIGGGAAQIETRAGDYLDAENVLPDMAFFAGGDLNITAKSTDDIFAAGADISISAAQADHMIVAGADITASDAAFHDLVAVGGDITLVSGAVTDDLVAAGGDLSIEQQFKIHGSAIVSGGDVTINGPIGAELRAAAGRLRLNGSVEGDANLTGGEIIIGPNVRIGGDLRHRARSIKIDPGAVVAGQIIELKPAARPDFEEWSLKAAAAAAAFALAFLIGMGVLVIVIAFALPALMNSAAAMIREKPLSALGVGFLASAAAPAVIALLFVSVLGIPLALLIAVFYAAAAPLAIAAFAYFLGMQGRRIAAKDASALPGALARAVWSALAALALAVVGLIPILGGVVLLVAYVFGMGAVVTRGGKALALKA